MENIFSMLLRVRNTSVTTINNTRDATVALGDAAVDMGTKFGKSLKATETSAAGLIGKLTSLKTLIALAFAYKAALFVGKGIKGLTDAAAEQELAERRLSSGLATTGQYSPERLRLLKEEASALQNLVGIGDNIILDSQTLLAAYGMEIDKIRILTPLILDFARVKGIDLTTAFNLVGKATAGYTGTLSRYGLMIDVTLSKEKQHQAILSFLTRFQGGAAVMADTYAGKMDKLGASYSDMKEPMGSTIQEIFRASGALDFLNSFVESNTNWWTKWGPLVGKIGTEYVTVLTEKVKELSKALDSPSIIKWGVTITNLLKLPLASIEAVYEQVGVGKELMGELTALSAAVMIREGAIIAGMKEQTELYDKIVESSVKGLWEAASEAGVEGTKNAEEWATTYAKAIHEMATVWEGGVGSEIGVKKWLDIQAKMVEAINAGRKAKEDADAASVKNQAEINSQIEETIKLTESMSKQFALANRLQQEQTKYLLEKSKRLTPEDVGGLTAAEKKIISSQNVLEQAYSELFRSYAEKHLGVSAVKKQAPIQIDIDMTPETKAFFDINLKPGTTEFEEASRAFAG